MNLRNIIAVAAVSASALFAQTPSRPFPQADFYSPQGSVIKPNIKDQEELNNDVMDLYDLYKEYYLESADNDRYYIRAEGNGPGGEVAVTISEAHGYGMIIFALMARHDNNAKEYFDGMNTLRKSQKSPVNDKLMAWVVVNPNSDNNTIGTATDGDLDNAYALLLAYKQWGDEDYLTEARELISAIKQDEMYRDESALRTKLGDGNWMTGSYPSRTSDWRPGHFRAFAEFSENAADKEFWNKVADNVYTMLGDVSDDGTGLIPDFVVGAGNQVSPDHIGGGTYENNADKYSYNGCRDPWFLALDFVHHGTPEAKEQIDKISSWLKEKTFGDPDRVYSSYELYGDVINGYDYNDMSFIAPFASGMIANSDNQEFLNDMYEAFEKEPTKMYLNDEDGKEYHNTYSVGIQLLNMILISGNWWAPLQETDGTYPVTVINGISENERYEPGETVNIEVEERDGKTFVKWTSDDGITFADEEDATTSFIMPNKAVKVTANFADINPKGNDLAYWTNDWETPDEGDRYGSTAELDTTIIGTIGFEFDVAAEDEAWTNISTYFEAGDFTDATSIEIEYNSTKDIKIVLIDGKFPDDGVSYCYTLLASETKKTISISSFTQPEWKETNNTYDLDKEKVYGISIDAIAIEGAASYIEGKITKLVINGLAIDAPTYMINYELGDGGVNHSDNPETYTSVTSDITLKAPTRSHYRFIGWFDEDVGGNKIEVIETGSTGDTTLYARWEIDHDWSKFGTVITPATCTTPSTHKAKCSICGEESETLQLSGQALGHLLDDLDNWITTKTATCTEAGNRKRTRTCTRTGCEHSEEQDDIASTALPALGHDFSVFGNWVIRAADCQNAGDSTRTVSCANNPEHTTDNEVRPIAKLTNCDPDAITDFGKPNDRMIFKSTIVLDKMEIILEEFIDVRFVVYDMTGNVVADGRGRTWNLKNRAGRFVANGSYQVVVEAIDRNRVKYRWSEKIGVKR